LKEDHDVVSSLFDEVRSTPESKHFGLFKKINAELETHAHIEETVFYPRLKKNGKQDLVDITLEGIEEHRQVKMFLDEMGGMKRGGDEFEAKLKVLMEDVEHHVDEEEGEMFPLVEDQFSDTALKRLGTSLLNKKKKFVESNPDIAKNLANRAAMRKKGLLGAIYETAVAVVGEMLGGKEGSKQGANGKVSPKSKEKTAKANGNGSKAAKKGSSKETSKKSTKTTAAKGRPAARRVAASSK
jgi:hemerythrin superfamily protein